MSSDLHNYGIIGFTSDNVGIDRRIYTGLTSTDPVLNVSYNGGRVDVYLNGIKLVGDHSEMPSGTRDYTFTQTGQGSSIQLRTGVALVSADVVECIGHVSGSGKTVNTYTPSVSAGDNTFNSSTTGMIGFTLQGSDLLNVYLNGVLLDSSDYTSDASADSVTITSLASGDVVHIQVIGALDYANFVPAGGGTFSGDVTVPNLIIGDGGNIGSASDTDAITIDSSGNVLVGKTVTSQNTAGTQISATTGVRATVDGNVATILNRTSSDGTIADFRKDGTSVGSIGAEGSDHLTIGTGDTGVLFADGHDAVHPWNISSNATRDNAIDLGRSSHRFKDLHLGGNVVIGTAGKGIDFSAQTTTSATNASVTSGREVLDHYEEGTWTPTAKSASSVNYTKQQGRYTRIGNLVTIWFDLNFDSLSGTSYPKIGGLPFAPIVSTQGAGYGAPQFRSATGVGSNFRIYGSSSYFGSASEIILKEYNSSGTEQDTTFSSSGRMTGQGFYYINNRS